jgi:uncharacterized protein YjbI with pentapeptide repeats
MRVFISWSGETGKAFAMILHEWLPRVLQAVKPFFSADDISKGAKWGLEIGAELEASEVGIIVVTRNSLTAPWVMFEAGALSKNVGRARVVPILVDVAPADIPGPLTQFQSAKFDAVDIKRMLRMLNSELKDLALTDDILESAFSVWWPKLDKQVTQLIRPKHKPKLPEIRSDRELLEEILGLSRTIAQNQSKKLPSALLGDDLSGTLTLSSIQKRLNHGGNLVGANMMGLNLAGIDLSGADLRGSNLVDANLSGAKLVGANLSGANLEGAVLNNADVNYADISRSNLWRASMLNVNNLASVKSMEEANFYEADLTIDDQKMLEKHNTLNIESYAELFAYYRDQGMSESDMREIFLWTAHRYPDVPLPF